MAPEIEDANEPIHFPTLAEIADTLKPVSWLWPGWIPRGMLSLLGAYQGTGKSYFVLDLARTVIHGGPWPDGTLQDRIGNCIYVEARRYRRSPTSERRRWASTAIGCGC